MDNLETLRRMVVFARVVEAGSFTAAAKELGIGKSAVSRQVSLLEEELGAPLLARTTRRLSLTDSGRQFHERASRMIAEAEAAVAEVRGEAARPSGTLKIAAPHHLGQEWVTPLAYAFHADYPEVAIDLVLEDRYTDLVGQNVDVAVRVGNLRDSSLIARKLSVVDEVLCASPDYVRTRGEPRDHRDLAGHDWIVYTLARTPFRQRITDPRGRRVTLRMNGPIRTNSGAATHALVRAGAGIAPLPRFYVEGDLASGRLVSLLPDYRFEPLVIQAVFLPGRDLLPKVRLFLDFLASRTPATPETP